MVSLQFVERFLEFLASFFLVGVQKEKDFNSRFKSELKVTLVTWMKHTRQ